MTLLLGLVNVLIARKTRRPRRGGVIGASLLLVLVTVATASSGGYYDAGMDWLYVVPVLAALLCGVRVGWLFTGVVCALMLAFWSAEELQLYHFVSQIPTELRPAHSLLNRITAVIAVAVTLSALAGREARRQAHLARNNAQLKLEMAERERAQEQLAKAQRFAIVGELAAGVGHEVNNPLTYVKANLELLQEETLPSHATRELVDEALDGISRVCDIVGNLRVLSGQRDTIELKPVELSAVITRALVLVPGLPAVSVDVPESTWVIAQEGPLVQIVVNLVKNATAALANASDPELEIRAHRVDDAVYIDLCDNGPGIPPELQGMIFDRLFTTGPSTGLGLSISRSLMHRFGGTLELVESDESGASFRLVLPAAQPPAA